MIQADKKRLSNVLLFLILSAVNVAFNAAAGPAAVATGAHVNDSSAPPPPGRVLGIGAAAGATRAGVLAFVGPLTLVNYLGVGPAHLLIVVSSVFGLSVLLTAQVCNEALGETPPELLKAALVAAAPIQLETAIRIKITPSGKEYKKIGKARMLVTLLIRYLQIIGWDALCGYTFATMAGSLGRPVCSRTAAAAAGGVYGAVWGISKLISDFASRWFEIKNE
ncbi:hypothetical protein RB597_010058 [Gaeumannomyces tritici]